MGAGIGSQRVLGRTALGDASTDGVHLIERAPVYVHDEIVEVLEEIVQGADRVADALGEMTGGKSADT